MSGIQDLFSPYPGYHRWAMNEIFRGELNPVGLYIPNIGDLVDDVPGNRTYKVSHRDETTGLSTLVVWEAQRSNGAMDNLDVFVTTGPGTASEAFRVYIDTSVLPYSLAFDDRVRIYSSDSTNVKLFLGVEITNNPTIVSAYYNQSGVLQGDNIPLELISTNNVTNVATKRPVIASCNRSIADGEIVTAVIYGAAGGVLSTSQFIVKNSRFIRGVNDATKYVTGITLKTPFLSPVDMRVINYPINVTVDTSHLIGVVHYNTGAPKEYPIDGVHFTLPGINGYVSTQAGTSVPLVLNYQLGADEMSYSVNTSQNGVISEPYRLVSTAPTGVYAVKLFGYPRWLDTPRGYVMEYYLYNLDRDLVVPVTPWVQLASGSPAFEPKLYATAQNFTVTINLNDINPMYETYNHVQPITVALNNQGSSLIVPNWTIGYIPNQNPRYGVDAVAELHLVSGSSWEVDISCGQPSKEAWIQSLYYAVHPLFDPSTELQAPTPTHVELVFANFSTEITVEQWNTVHTLPSDLNQGEVLGLRWIRRTVSGDLQLAYSAIPCHLV